jgi:hypothetical protein
MPCARRAQNESASDDVGDVQRGDDDSGGCGTSE